MRTTVPVEWGAPQWGNAGATFTIGDQQVSKVELTNTVTKKPKLAVSVGDYVWEEVNHDGIQDPTDKPLAGVEFAISRTDGKPVLTS